MKQILIVEASPRGPASASRALTRSLIERLKAQLPTAKIANRDLAKDKLPALEASTVSGIFTRDPAEALSLKETMRLSDQLTDELLASDMVVIATPMWNFAVPSSIKAWIDLIVRPGRTFNYTGTGVVGLTEDKQAILVLASSGVFTEGECASWDFVEPYLRRILGFIGIDDVQTIRAEGMNIPSLAEHAVSKGKKAIERPSL
jgi:FMN-dependent NADH-azoreductase